MDAVEGELAGLRGGGVWDEPNVKSSKEVLKNNPEAHIADLFSICGIKNYDGPVEDQIMKARLSSGDIMSRKAFRKRRSCCLSRPPPIRRVCVRLGMP